MKICQIITTLELGGAETLLANFCNILSEQHEITVIYLKGEPKILKLFKKAVHVKLIPLNAGSARAIRNFITSWKAEVVHTHLGHADFIGLWAVRGLPVKTFCTMHNIYFKWDWRDKIIFSVYRLYFHTFAQKCQVICISKVVADHVLKTLKVAKGKTHILYNGIPAPGLYVTKEEARKQLGLANDKFILLFVGRLEKQKAVHVLLNAVCLLQELSNLQVEIIGSGSLSEELNLLAEKLSIRHVVNFRGNTFTPEPWFLAADVFVLPSLFEGLGIVILEAFRSRLAVIASDIEGPAELIENNRNGLLFKAGNSEILAEKIRELYSNSGFGYQLSEEAYLRYINNFSIRSYASSLEELYKL